MPSRLGLYAFQDNTRDDSRDLLQTKEHWITSYYKQLRYTYFYWDDTDCLTGSHLQGQAQWMCFAARMRLFIPRTILTPQWYELKSRHALRSIYYPFSLISFL